MTMIAMLTHDFCLLEPRPSMLEISFFFFFFLTFFLSLSAPCYDPSCLCCRFYRLVILLPYLYNALSSSPFPESSEHIHDKNPTI